MPQAAVAWSVACVALVVAAAALAWAGIERRRRRAQPGRLPADWAVGPRPVFNTDERRLRRRLAEAFPNQLVLTKLQLTRFCHPDNPRELRYWYDLLSPLYVSFAVSSESGRVLAVVDIDDTPEGATPSGKRRRTLRIKQAVFEACRIRYARCPAGQLPTIDELRALLPDNQASGAAAAAPTSLSEARAQLAQTVASRRRARERVDSARGAADFQDSFFSTDRRFDPSSPSGFDILTAPATGAGALDEADDLLPPSSSKRPPRHRMDLPVLMTEVIGR